MTRLAILAGIVIFVVTAVVVLRELLPIYCFPWESGVQARGDGVGTARDGQWRDLDAEMCPNCVTPWKCNGPHVFGALPREQTGVETA